MFNPGRRSGRVAFTLIELLVVIAIIGILAALTTAAVIKVLSKGPEVQTRNEITQLGIALQNFKTNFYVYPPSKIRLRPKLSDYQATDPLDVESLTYLNRLWPKISNNPKVINWAGYTDAAFTQPKTVPSTGIVLEGDQCLVFFLGGITDMNGLAIGFSTNPIDPSDFANTPGRKGPYFDFKTARLKDRGASGFNSYFDYFEKQPYLYFAPKYTTRKYDPSHGIKITYTELNPPPPVTVTPYYETATKYHAPDSFQIISAGADTHFGPGGQWTAAGAADIAQAGRDDMTSFHPNLMGAP